MANLQLTRQKIQATLNTAKITKAMQMVSAVKLKRFQGLVSDTENYLLTLKDFIADAIKGYSGTNIDLLSNHKTDLKTDLIVLIGVNRGLVGPLTGKLELAFMEQYNTLKTKGRNIDVITVKKKTIDMPVKYGIKVKNHFENSFESIDISSTTTLKSILMNDFIEGIYENVYVVYPKFINAMTQTVTALKFLPFSKDDITDKSKVEVKEELIFEPSQEEVLNTLFENYTESFISYFLLHASASEYSARVVAMKMATDNAKEIEGKLKNIYFKTRQSIITSQIQESTRRPS